MIDLLLHPNVLEILLVCFTLLTPVLSIILKKRLSNYPRLRLLILLAGPVTLSLWLLQLLLISTLGFASVKTFLVLLIAGITLGIMGGLYLRPEFSEA